MKILRATVLVTNLPLLGRHGIKRRWNHRTEDQQAPVSGFGFGLVPPGDHPWPYRIVLLLSFG
jgi:hypothetical protein